MIPKQKIILPTLVTILLVAMLFTSPIAVAQPAVKKVKYTLPGDIWNADTGTHGTISLAINGMIKGAPDFEFEDSGTGEIQNSWDYYSEWHFWEDGVEWKAVDQGHHEETGTFSYSVHFMRWYSPLSKYTGELVVIWQDGSTTKFKADLSPIYIQKSEMEQTMDGSWSESGTIEYWYYDVDSEEWILDLDRTETYSYGGPLPSYAYSYLDLAFSGKIQSKGRPPFEGVLFVQDHEDVTDGSVSHSIWANGMFGPYSVYAYKSV